MADPPVDDGSSSLGSAFTSLLVAAFATSVGDGIRLAALPLLAESLTSAPLMIAGITAAQFLPWTTFAPIGGVIVDRSDRRRLIMMTQSWRALVMAGLAVVIALGVVEVWHLMVVAYVITVGEILVDPAVVATIPTLVEPRQLDRANGRLTSVETVTNDFAGGPLGALTFLVAPWLPFVIDAVSYGSSVAPFSRLPSSTPSPSRESSLRDEMGEGLRWLGAHSFLRPVTGAIAVFHLGTSGALALLVLFVRDELDGSRLLFGVTLAAAALGATLASTRAAVLAERFGHRAVVTVGGSVVTASVFAAAAAQSSWHLVAVWAANGAAAGILISIGRGFVQRHTPQVLLWRSFGVRS